MQGIAFYTDGIYEQITEMDSLTQVLLQIFLPNPEDRRNIKTAYLLNQTKNAICQDCNTGIAPDKMFILIEQRQSNYMYIYILVLCEKCAREKNKKL